MAESTYLTSYCRYGYLSSDGYSYTSGWSIGYSSGHAFRGILRFPDLLLHDAEIQSMNLVLNRKDTYAGKDNYFSFCQSITWGAATVNEFHWQVPGGTGVKTLNLMPYKDLIQSYVGDWCIVANRYTQGEFCQFYGDEDGSKAPKLVVTYENAIVEYYTSGAWQRCLVYYRNSAGVWQKCIPYYYTGGAWVKV